MGTNYYLETQAPCECCGRGYEQKHIGKHSVGWCFSLHIYPDDGIYDLDDWEVEWEDRRIFNEYGEEIPHERMIAWITKLSAPRIKESNLAFHGIKTIEEFLDLNHAELGPNNLLRSKVDGVRCVGHGKGTWDLLVGDFS